MIPETNFKVRRRLVASGQLQGILGGVLDSVMIESREENDGNDAEWSIPLLSRKSLPFLHIYFQDTFPDSIAIELGTEFCFVKYFQIVGKEELSINGVDKCLSCVRLRWD